jgi:hypothetical protein
MRRPCRGTLNRRLDERCDLPKTLRDALNRHEPAGARMIKGIDCRFIARAHDPQQPRHARPRLQFYHWAAAVTGSHPLAYSGHHEFDMLRRPRSRP